MKDVKQEIARMRRMTVPELIDQYEKLFGKPPRCKSREHLWKRCVWRTQEQHYGGLSQAAKARLEELISEIDLPTDERQRTVTGRLRGTVHAREHKAGTVFSRPYKGREIRAQALEGGNFEYDGNVYTSLSAIAKKVTGTRWNGRLFFGLTKRRGR